MKKTILIAVSLLILLPVMLSAKFEYLSEEEYKDLKRDEVKRYWEKLENKMAEYQERKANAIAQNQQCQARRDELKKELTQVNSEYETVYGNIMAMLGVDEASYAAVNNSIDYFQSEATQWESMSDKQLWENKTQLRELLAEYEEYRDNPESKVPDFRTEFSDLDNRYNNLARSLEAAKPKYYEDSYTVVKGD
ncbi:MAG: hypothetical protein SVM86_04200, partial [Candidatus Cloacimonadota bacterium]|nr:hypothetical protein [Candidatus Cloacimonadota bacterium]